MIQHNLGDVPVIFVVPCGETPPSTTGKKRAGGSEPPHCEVEGPASPDEGALAELTELEGFGMGSGWARNTGFPVAGYAPGLGWIVTLEVAGLPASSACCTYLECFRQ